MTKSKRAVLLSSSWPAKHQATWFSSHVTHKKIPPYLKKKSINQLSRGLFLFPVHQDEARDERGSWL